MKKFYEAPVVELTGFSAEDVITTSTAVINTITDTFDPAVLTGYNGVSKVNEYDGTGATTYEW